VDAVGAAPESPILRRRRRSCAVYSRKIFGFDGDHGATAVVMGTGGDGEIFHVRSDSSGTLAQRPLCEAFSGRPDEIERLGKKQSLVSLRRWRSRPKPEVVRSQAHSPTGHRRPFGLPFIPLPI
jgi:hypothetical protein